MTARPTQQNGESLGQDASPTAIVPARCAVRGAVHRGRNRLTMHGGQFRIARAVMDVVAGVDPGAVRLAQTLLGMIPSRRAASRDPKPSRRGGVAFSTPGGAR